MKIGIVGCRPPNNDSWLDVEIYSAICGCVESVILALPSNVTIVSGEADGVDLVAKKQAKRLKLKYIGYPPNYKAHGAKAPHIRNALITQDCDELIAFPAPWSRGTWHTVHLMQAAQKKFTVNEAYRTLLGAKEPTPSLQGALFRL